MKSDPKNYLCRVSSLTKIITIQLNHKKNKNQFNSTSINESYISQVSLLLHYCEVNLEEDQSTVRDYIY